MKLWESNVLRSCRREVLEKPCACTEKYKKATDIRRFFAIYLLFCEEFFLCSDEGCAG